MKIVVFFFADKLISIFNCLNIECILLNHLWIRLLKPQSCKTIPRNNVA